MIVSDVNLLLYAEIDAFPQHPSARRWWEGVLNGERRWASRPSRYSGSCASRPIGAS
jgi:predicted nucleic acid-binding protein